MFTRFNGNVVPFADDSTSTNRTVFGGTTQSDLIDDNLNTNFKKGWEIVGLNDNPTREDFNAMGYTLGALTAYLYEMGISEWNASQNYRANSRVTGSDGKIYKSLTGTAVIPNVGNNPTTDAVNWTAEGSTDYSALIDKTTPADADLIAIADSTSSFSLKKLSWTNMKATLKTYFDTLYVSLTANQTVAGVKTFSSTINGSINGNSATATKLATARTINGVSFDGTANITVSDATAVSLTANEIIAGVKTFSSSPIVPTPTAGTQAVNKDYADLKVALSNFIGTNQMLSASGYQKLPGGLIIQWGNGTSSGSTSQNVNFPIAFPSVCINVLVSLSEQDPVDDNPTATALSKTGFCLRIGTSSYLNSCMYIALGY